MKTNTFETINQDRELMRGAAWPPLSRMRFIPFFDGQIADLQDIARQVAEGDCFSTALLFGA